MSITLDGTTGIVAPAIDVATPITVSDGGTGLSALGTANQILGVNAGATALEYKTAAAGGFSNMTVITSPGTFTTPATTTKIKVTVVGGGGNGGNGGTVPLQNPGLSPGGTGGGAGFSQGVFTVAASTPFPVTVATPSNTSSFSSLISATGGTAGGFPSATNGTGGSGTGGSFNLEGTPGSPVYVVRGNSIFGSTTNSAPVTTGTNALNYGAGAGGGRGPTGAGGVGAPGIVIVEF
jgi:hypothetical protein